MTIDFGTIKSYNTDRGFGFVGRTFLKSDEKVFFHIKKIREKYTELANELDNGKAAKKVSFWYEIETTEKGKQVSNLWLSTQDIPQSYAHKLCDLIQEIESIWRNVNSSKPSWLDLVTIELVGVGRKNELSNESDNLERQLRLAEEQRPRETKAGRFRQIRAKRERERQETELRNRLKAQIQQQIRVNQEEKRRVVEQQYPDRKDEIRQICEEIGIQTLVHFTHIQNLKSILKEGLLGRKQLEAMKVKFHHNDELRLEGKREAICCSISFPNYQMFYKYRCSNQPDTNWVVLFLKSSILWEIECRFYVENAASNNARQSELKEDKSQPSALRKMFEDYGAIQRMTLRIPNNFTTHPQAEVMVLNTIPVKYIQSVVFYDQHTAEDWLEKNYVSEASCINFHYDLNNHFFNSRQDWKFWKSLKDQSHQNNMCILDLDDNILF